MTITETMRKQVYKILENKSIVACYQPIVSLKDGSVYGYEALSRTTLPVCDFNVEEMFSIAKE